MSVYVCNVLPNSNVKRQPTVTDNFDHEPLLPPSLNAKPQQDDTAQDQQQDDEQDKYAPDDQPLLPPTLAEMQRREDRKRVRGATPTPGLEMPLLPSHLQTVHNADEEPLVAPQMKFNRG